MTSTWVGACGFRSRKATVVSVRRTTSAGSSPATILQKMQSATAADGSPPAVLWFSHHRRWGWRAKERSGGDDGEAGVGAVEDPEQRPEGGHVALEHEAPAGEQL